MAEQLGFFDILGEIGNQISRSSYLRDMNEAEQAGDFQASPALAYQENNRRVRRAMKKGRMSDAYIRSKGFDPVMLRLTQQVVREVKEIVRANRPVRPVSVPDYDPAVFEIGPNQIDAYQAVADETPAERAAFNAPVSLPARPVSASQLDYTGAVGVPEYTPEYVNQAVADVESGRYSPERIARDAVWTAASVPMTALQMGLNAANPLLGGALDPLINRYNEGTDIIKRAVASDQLLESERAVQQQIANGEFAGTLGTMAQNPGWLLSEAIRNMGSMAVPTGIAGGTVKAAQALPWLGRLLPTAERASGIGSQVGNVAMNVGSTFSDKEMQDLPLWKRYLAGGISGLGTALVGAATEGGAEGQIARSLFGKEANAAANEFNPFGLLTSAGKEALQEGVEGGSDYLGQHYANDEPVSLQEMLVQNLPDMVMGAITGAATHAGTSLRNGQQAQAVQQQPSPEAVARSLMDLVDNGGAADAFNQAVNTQQQAAQPMPQTQQPVQRQAAEPVQQMPVQPETPVADSAQSAAASPLDVVRENGGISRKVMADLGWTDRDMAKLPEGIVAQSGGMDISQAADALNRAGFDTDVEALVDYASRPVQEYAFEDGQQPQQMKPQQQPGGALMDAIGQLFGQSGSVPEGWDSGIQQDLMSRIFGHEEQPSADWQAGLPDMSRQQENTQQTAQEQPEQPVQVPETAQLTREDTQNRDRSSRQSIAQMNSIAGNPDYGRLGVGTDFGNGSPVVYGDDAFVAKGNTGTMVAADGRRIPFQYGVVEADRLIPSNLADGTRVAEYDTGAKGKLRAIAGNGRTAGLKEAYNRGTAGQYRAEMTADAGHGVPASAIRRMKHPVLVRVMPESHMTPDLADVSNTATNAVLTPLEQARNDARRIDIGALEFGDNGVSDQNVRDFVKSLPVSEQTALLSKDGMPTRQAEDRLMAAVFASAYDSDELIDLYAQAKDPESRNVLNGLASAAYKMVQLKGMGDFDVRSLVVEAAESAVNAQRRGERLEDYAATVDMVRSPETDMIIGMLVQNRRSARRIGEALQNLADVMANGFASQDSMFGDGFSRQEGLDYWRDTNYGTEQGSAGVLRQHGRAGTDEGGDVGQAADSGTEGEAARNEPEEPSRPVQEEGNGQQEEGLTLSPTTPDQLRAEDEARQAEEKRQAEEERKAREKAQADAEVDRFALSGSDSQADVLESQGQQAMFSKRADSNRGFTVADNPAADEIAEANRQYDEVVAQYKGTDQWMKAPNGKPTKLNERQWVTVRTDNYKNWLGFDWERDAGFVGGLLQEGGQGNGIQEGTPAGSLETDSELPVMHNKVENLVLQARQATSNGDYGRARELHKRIGEALGRLNLIDAETGEPRVFYHGTQNSFDAFDLDSPEKKDRGWLGKGIYLAGDTEDANYYARSKKGEVGQNVMPLFVRMRNPYITDVNEKNQLGINDDQQAQARTDDLKAQGYDGVLAYDFRQDDWYEFPEAVAFEPSDVKSATGNAGIFSPDNPSILYRLAGDSNRLMAVHNLSGENLVFADEMGGLAVPSIGVVGQEQGEVAGFGEITLIGTKELGTPERNPVFSSDAYTARFPRPVYKRVPMAKRESLDTVFPEDVFQENLVSRLDYTIDNQRPDRDRFESTLRNSYTAKQTFLKSIGKGVRVVMMPERYSSIPYETLPGLKPYADAIDFSLNELDMLDTPEYKAFADRVEAIKREQYKSEKNRYKGDFFEKMLQLNLNEVGNILADIDNYGKAKKVVDQKTMMKRVNERIKKDEAGFHAWVKSLADDVFGEPFLDKNGRTVPYTLDNIVDVMTSSNARNKEDTLTFGTGQARAAISKRFRNLETMRKQAGEKIVNDAEYKAARENTDKLLESYRSAVSGYTKLKNWRGEPDIWEAMDASMRAVARYLSGGDLTEAAFKNALKREDFQARIPSAIIRQGMEAADALMKAPVPYFESKPQRAVSLDEFAGAVIPKNTPQNVRDILAKHGIRTFEYDGENRTAVTRQAAADLNSERTQTLFQKNEGQQQGRSKVADIEKAIASDPVNRIATVVQSVSDLPGNVGRDAPGVVEGAFVVPNGKEPKVYIIADNVTPERAAEVARHEVIGHYGMERMLGKDLMDKTVDQVVYALNHGNKVLNDLADEVDRTQPGLDERTRAKEVIAVMAERNMQNSVVRRVLNAIRRFLAKIGLVKSDITDAEVADLLRKAREHLLESGRDMVGGDVVAQGLPKPKKVVLDRETRSRLARSWTKRLDAIHDAIGVKSFVEKSVRDIRDGKKTLEQHFKDLEDFKKRSDRADEIAEIEGLIEDLRRGEDGQSGEVAFSKDSFERNIDEAIAGTRSIVNLGMPPKVLVDAGVANVRLQISSDVINKMKDRHNLTVGQIKRLPELLKSPIMVFRSATEGGHVVVVDDVAESSRGKMEPVIVSIRPNGNVTINYIRSAYARNNFANAVERWVNDGLLVSAQKETATDLLDLYSQRDTSAAGQKINSSDVKSIPQSVVQKDTAEWLTTRGLQLPKVVQAINSGSAIRLSDGRKQGNTDVENTTVLHSVKPPVSNQAQSSMNMSRKAFDVPDVTRFDNIRRAMQDRMLDIKKVQDAIEKDGGVVSERENVYRREELYASRLDARIKRIEKDSVAPILEAVKESKMSLEEVDQWLAARHILLDQVNDRLAAMNPNHPDRDRLSGMSDAEAQAVFHKGAGNQALYRVGDLVDKLTRRNVQQRVVNGLMTQAEADQWLQYRHYVPLKRDSDGAGVPKSRGFMVKGSESKRRMGSTLAVKDVLANLFADTVNVAQRIEKARVTRSLLDLARNHPNDDFWQVDQPKKVKRVNKDTGLVETVYRDENMVPSDDVLVVKENGIEHWIKFNTRNERALRIAEAMRNMDVDDVKGVVGAIGKVTRYMGGWMTQKNPAFMFSNFLRDIQDAAFNLADTPIKGKEGQLIARIPAAMRAIWHMERGTVNGNTEMARYAREFRDAGGETAYLDLRGSIKEQAEALNKRLKELADDGTPSIKKTLRAVGGVIEHANSSVENSVRLATFVTARKAGLSLDAAASLAKNITVNFNRKGTSTRVVNSLYLFANANVQGHARMLRALVKSRRGRIVAGVLVGVSFALSMLGRASMGDGWDDLPEWEKANNWIMPVGGSNYLKVPIGPGLKLFHYAGMMLEDVMFGKSKRSLLETAFALALTVVDNFNVLGSAGSPGQLISPTVARPIVQLWENKSWTGKPVHREPAPFGGYNPPAYSRAFSTTPVHWKKISKLLNDVSGGDDVTPGYLDFAPESISLAMKAWLIPGTVNEVDRALTAVEHVLGDDVAVSPRMVPLLNRVYGQVTEGSAEQRFYQEVAAIRQQVYQIKEYDKQDRQDDFEKAVKRFGDGDLDKGYDKLERYDDFMKELRTLNRERTKAMKDGDKAEVQAIELDRQKVYKAFNEGKPLEEAYR